jgi:hypothetical protein
MNGGKPKMKVAVSEFYLTKLIAIENEPILHDD